MHFGSIYMRPRLKNDPRTIGSELKRLEDAHMGHSTALEEHRDSLNKFCEAKLSLWDFVKNPKQLSQIIRDIYIQLRLLFFQNQQLLSEIHVLSSITKQLASQSKTLDSPWTA